MDSDPNINDSATLFRDQGWTVVCFNETADALNALRNQLLNLDHVKCVITSMMERDGRRERGLLSGLQMLDKMKKSWEQNKTKQRPLLVVNSLTANMEECKKHGVDIVVSGDRKQLQEKVIDRLTAYGSNRYEKQIRLYIDEGRFLRVIRFNYPTYTSSEGTLFHKS